MGELQYYKNDIVNKLRECRRLAAGIDDHRDWPLSTRMRARHLSYILAGLAELVEEQTWEEVEER